LFKIISETNTNFSSQDHVSAQYDPLL
jgi:hypothetical protein